MQVARARETSNEPYDPYFQTHAKKNEEQTKKTIALNTLYKEHGPDLWPLLHVLDANLEYEKTHSTELADLIGFETAIVGFQKNTSAE